MIIKYCTGLVVFVTLSVQAQEHATMVHGRIVDEETHEAVRYAHIRMDSTEEGTIADSAGYFHLPRHHGKYKLRISCVGYQTAWVSVDHFSEKRIMPVFLRSNAIRFEEEVIVSAPWIEQQQESYYLEKKLNTTDDILEKTDGLSLIRRGNFGLEPAIRGLSGGQIQVLVDDMKIFGACIDKMDPVTSYVEIDNLEKIEVAKGGFDMSAGQTIGGSLNLRTGKPDFSVPFAIGVQTGYENVSHLRFVRSTTNWSGGAWAARAGVSLRKSDDFRAGDGRLMHNSGYNKSNVKTDIAHQNGNHTWTASYIRDVATDAGYPVLLMDTRRAVANIFGLEHQWRQPWHHASFLNTKVYFNMVDHDMDDYDRDVTARDFMPNMYMPMYGNTRTIGFSSNLYTGDNIQGIKWVVDFYRMTAFADMDMQSLDPEVSPMYLVNIGSTHVYNYAAAAEYRRLLTEKIVFKSSFRLDYSVRSLHDDIGRRELEGYWNRTHLNTSYITFSASAAAEWQMMADQKLRLALARTARTPTHIENYGFYFYNVSDGFIYTGNPNLKPEISYQSELSYEYKTDKHISKAQIFYTRIDRYIAGITTDTLFKQIENVHHADLAGIEASHFRSITNTIAWQITASYRYSRVSAWDEPMPGMAPLEVLNSVRWVPGSYWFELSNKTAASQNRFAKQQAVEHRTHGFTLFTIRGGIKVNKHAELQWGVENVLDTDYREHANIQKMPGRGRNVYLTLQWNHWAK